MSSQIVEELLAPATLRAHAALHAALERPLELWERKAPRTNRMFKANVQIKTLTVGTVTRRFHVCTRCIRTNAKVR